MNNLKAFLSESAIQKENIKVVVSERFVDENKKPIPWEIKAIEQEEFDAISKRCKKRRPALNNPSQTVIETDVNKLVEELVSACVVYPNLNDEELQKSYDAIGDIATVKKMLTPGEFTKLSQAIQQSLGFDTGMEDNIEKAKN